MNIAIQLWQDSAASFEAIFSFVMRGVRPGVSQVTAFTAWVKVLDAFSPGSFC